MMSHAPADQRSSQMPFEQDLASKPAARSVASPATVPSVAPAATVHLRARRARPFFARHPWVFSGAIARVDGNPANGDVVAVVSDKGQFIASGFWNRASQIRVRLLSWDTAARLDQAWFDDQIGQAIQLRQQYLGLNDPHGACRLVHGEADGLPGLVVDRYADTVVIQLTSLGMAQREGWIMEALNRQLQPCGIYRRTERQIGQLEGLDLTCAVVSGQVPDEPIQIVENELTQWVDLRTGQKTGAFLDQRENRQRVRQLADGKRVLDLFCYTAGFTLAALAGGAREVVAVDTSVKAIELARRNLEQNQMQAELRVGDARAVLRELNSAGERFDLIVCDPPKFARSAGHVRKALRAYEQLNGQAMELLEDGGLLVTCSCSQLVDSVSFAQMLNAAASAARRRLHVLEMRGAAADHPVGPNCLETDYLKCWICLIT